MGAHERSGYYETAAATYDETRGGAERAGQAAAAIARLVPGPAVCVDVGGGTGSVSAALADRGFDVVVADRSPAMLRVAAGRLPGRVLVIDAAHLPLADASVDLVTTIWLLHLLPTETADAVAAEAARVLRPGGHWVTTVDKFRAHQAEPAGEADDAERVDALAERLGLRPAGRSSFGGDTVWATAPGADHQEWPLVAYRA